jgi:transcriptional regulator with XRE-family HTH domain
MKPAQCCANMKSENSDKAIGKMLKSLRESRGIKQNFVAEKLGISNNFLSQLESGDRRWYALMVKKYENIIGA